MKEGVGERVDGDLWRVLHLLLSVLLEGIGAQLYALGQRQPRLHDVLLRQVVKCKLLCSHPCCVNCPTNRLPSHGCPEKMSATAETEMYQAEL